MTPLAERLSDLIRINGPMTVAEFMTLCLIDPEHGYYMRREPFGRTGDFITAPEISQMFGELIGLWAVAVWEMMGGPKSFVFAELGPGRGTLMADMLRTARVKPAFLKAAEVHLVEISPRLTEIQQATLAKTGVAVHWHASVADLPPGPAIIIANEFFDALPIRQFRWGNASWSERVVGLNEQGQLAFGLVPVEQRAPAVLLPEGSIIESSPASKATMTAIAERLKEFGGAALVVDYGNAQPTHGDTLQAVRAHKFDNPLTAPGESDITAHVDFAALARAAEAAGATVRTLMGQGEFLIRLGLVDRANVLGRGKDQATRDALAKAMERLAAPKAMGTLFKVLAISSPGLKLPIFDPIEIGGQK
jgi:NADH dehydrogenase [ubiquinone] 1 alpha subcomplex assembly factor 7